MSVTLVCPLCGVTAHRGGEPAPGACPGCGARYAGGGDSPPAAVAAALAEWGAGDLDARTLADGLFALMPDEPLSERIAVTSDRREGFYRWWIFLAAGEEPRPLLGEVAGRG